LRDKNKRKKQRQQTLQGSNPTSISASADQETPRTQKGKSPARKQQQAPMTISKRFKVIAQFLAQHFKLVLEAIAIVTAITVALIYYRQLDVMRETLQVDQRPWIKLDVTNNPMQSGKPLTGKLHFVNYGKTPARNFHGKFSIDRIVNGEQPSLEYDKNYQVATIGMIYPNAPEDFPLQWIDETSKQTPVPLSLSQSDADLFTQGKIFFVFFGEVDYSDFAGVQHWTRYLLLYCYPDCQHDI
jgi:hypothetical protein